MSKIKDLLEQGYTSIPVEQFTENKARVEEVKKEILGITALIKQGDGDEELLQIGKLTLAAVRLHYGERAWVVALKEIVDETGEHLRLTPMEQALIANPS